MADGKGCICWANSYSECGCDADWTPQEVYDLKAALARKDEEIAEYRRALIKVEYLSKNSKQIASMTYNEIAKEVLENYPKE